MAFWNSSAVRFDTSADLTISVSSPSNNQVLAYNGTNWVNSSITSIDLSGYYTKIEINGKSKA